MYASRCASHAGSWYSDGGHTLAVQLDGWLATTSESAALRQNGTATYPAQVACTRALIAPHAGYRFSGATAAHSYAALEDALRTQPITRILILGPSHHSYIAEGCALSGASALETPLGSLAVDRDLVKTLLATGKFRLTTRSEDEEEHSLEMQLPFIARVLARARRGSDSTITTTNRSAVLPGVSVLPVMVGSLDYSAEQAYGALLAPIISDPSTFTVISSDFCHWGKRFSYSRMGDGTGPIWQCIQALDRRGMDLIEACNHAGFSAYLKETRNTICGRHPIGILLAALQVLGGGQRGSSSSGSSSSGSSSSGSSNGCTKASSTQQHRIQFVAYAQSSRCEEASDSSVSYAAAVVYVQRSGGGDNSALAERQSDVNPAFKGRLGR